MKRLIEPAGSRAPARVLGGTLGLLLALHVPVVSAQTSTVGQDELDFQARTSLSIGAGARAIGMGGAFLARADDATAASWNPAGLSYLRQPEFSIVGSWSSQNGQELDLDFKPDDTNPEATALIQKDSSKGSSPDFASITYPFEVRSLSGAAQLSFQRVFSFQGERTILRGVATSGDPNVLVFESQGGFDALALGTGVQVSRRLRLGATVNRWFSGFRQSRSRVPDRPNILTVDFNFSGWNTNLGAIWSPRDDLNLALAGRTSFTGKVALDRTRVDFPAPTRPDPTSNGFSSDDVRLDFPGAFGMGASWRPRSTITISADYTRTFWSGARIRRFFTLPLTGVPRAPDDVFFELPYPLLKSGQTDTEQLRLGFEYVLLGRRVRVPLRIGLFSDGQYFRAEDGSIPRFLGFTLGGGVLVGPFLFDVAYLYEDGQYASGPAAEAGVRIRRFYASLIYRYHGRP